jgi:hypothetical protein
MAREQVIKNGNLAIPEGTLTFGDWKPPRETSIWKLEFLILPFVQNFDSE